MFAFPLKKFKCDFAEKKLLRSLHSQRSSGEEEMSLSSLESIDQKKEIRVREAMIMCFLCKRKKRPSQVINTGTHATGITSKQHDYNKKSCKFSVDLRMNGEQTKVVKTRLLIKAIHDITDILNLHHQKIYYHINEFVELNRIAETFVKKVQKSNLKKDHSF